MFYRFLLRVKLSLTFQCIENEERIEIGVFPSIEFEAFHGFNFFLPIIGTQHLSDKDSNH
jgi:hypothetical protein